MGCLGEKVKRLEHIKAVGPLCAEFFQVPGEGRRVATQIGQALGRAVENLIHHIRIEALARRVDNKGSMVWKGFSKQCLHITRLELHPIQLIALRPGCSRPSDVWGRSETSSFNALNTRVSAPRAVK